MAAMKLCVGALLALSLLLSISTATRMRSHEEEKGEQEEGEGEYEGSGEIFKLKNPKQVVKTDGGEVRVMKGFIGKGISTPIHIGLINMEPSTLFIPQYMDASLILFVRRGEMRIGSIYKDNLVEKNLKIGDVYRIPVGSAFYMVNTGTGQRLQIICSFDASESLGTIFQSFYIGGGSNPPSLLAGFDKRTLATAFNVSTEELSELLGRQRGGPIVYASAAEQPSSWASLMRLKQQQKQQEVQGEEPEREEEETETWVWRKLMYSMLGKGEESKKRGVDAPDPYNLYERDPDFRNAYGWSLAVDEEDYSPLKKSGVGVYLVNLTAGAMMAPHINPTATEYGIVLKGSGTIQVVFPNGTTAMDAEVTEGDAFWVPRYFPFCQIASRSGPMEFFGFTTSARPSRPQFLVGASSILQTMKGPEMATAFAVSEDKFRDLIHAQKESIILPPSPLAPRFIMRA